MLLYDSTPYASKGHIALVLPCDEAHLVLLVSGTSGESTGRYTYYPRIH